MADKYMQCVLCYYFYSKYYKIELIVKMFKDTIKIDFTINNQYLNVLSFDIFQISLVIKFCVFFCFFLLLS